MAARSEKVIDSEQQFLKIGFEGNILASARVCI